MEQMKFYMIDKDLYTISELREGYKTITGLDNGDEMTDKQIYEYMKKALFENAE